MDFRMDKRSYFMLVFIFATMAFFIIQGGGKSLTFIGYLQAGGFALLSTVALVGLSCIPVIFYCYFAKKIPDIDYSINVAFVVTVIGIITEIIF